MAYQEFAYFYDEFNGAADYDALFAYVTGELKAHGIQDGIVADFGCGTGELTAALARKAGQVIGVDQSAAMIRAAREKFTDGPDAFADTVPGFASPVSRVQRPEQRFEFPGEFHCVTA